MSHRILRLLATVAVAVLVACASPPGGGTLLFAVTDSASSGGSGVTVNVVCPGPTDTPLLRDATAGMGAGDRFLAALQRAVPIGRLAQPDDIAPAIGFLASEPARFITGQTLSVSGGLTMS